MLKPKLFTTLKDYKLQTFYSDLLAGIVVGIVALPLAIAFGIASGVTPSQGLITAVIGGFIISALGGSKVQIGGPTGAFVVIVAGIVQKYGMDGLTVATFMAGIILVIMGFAKLGSIIKFIPHPVIVGFTTGIAVIIFSSQIKDLFGLSIPILPPDFIHKWGLMFYKAETANFYSLGIGLLSLIIIIYWNKVNKKLPGTVIALLVATLLVKFMHLPVETIGDKFGAIAAGLPPLKFPNISFETFQNLIMPATTIALLAAIESLLSAVVSDGMIGGRHRSNMELIAQGVANIFTPLFNGIPATGAIARTVTNIKNGGKTPVAGIIHSIVLLLIMLFFGKYAVLIPMTSLAAILIVVAYNMSEWRSFISMLKSPKSDVVVLVTTFLLTVIFDLTIAVEVGMLLSVFLFMRSMAMVTNVGVLTREMTDDDPLDEDINSIDKKSIPQGVEVFEINGPFFFGAAHKFKEAINSIGSQPKVVIVRMRNVPAIDSTGIHVLEEFYSGWNKDGVKVILSGVHSQPFIALEKIGLIHKIGEKNCVGTIDDALTKAKELIAK